MAVQIYPIGEIDNLFGCLNDDDFSIFQPRYKRFPSFNRNRLKRGNPFYSTLNFGFDSDDDDNCCKKICYGESSQKKKLKRELNEKKSNKNLLFKTQNFKDYKPSDVEIKVGDGAIEIEGSSSQEKDGFSLRRKIWQKIPVPKEMKEEDLDVSFSKNGSMTISKKRQEKQIEQ